MESKLIRGSLILALLLSGEEISLSDQGWRVGSIIVPERIDLNFEFRNSLVQVKVLDEGGEPLPWIRVEFISADPGSISFPYPAAATDRNGLATNFLVRNLDQLIGFVTTILVLVEGKESDRVPVIGTSVTGDGSTYFRAPPLAPFKGPMQHLIGYFQFFMPEMFPPKVWSIDPTIAEPSNPILGAVDEKHLTQGLEFDVTAYRLGRTIFIVHTIDISTYEAIIEGELHPEFLRADSDGSGLIGLDDCIRTIHYLFLSDPGISCLEAADADDSGEVNISDPIFTLYFLYLGGSDPPKPYPEAGPDPTPDLLGCG